jgi:nucleoid-associated protein YgaU
MAAMPSFVGRSAPRHSPTVADRLRLVDDPRARAESTTGHSRASRPQQTAAARRRLGTLAAVCALVALWFGTGALAGSPSAAQRPSLTVASGTVYVVRAGDTLESIAHSLANKSAVSALARTLAKELHGKPLRPGMVLRVR